MGRHEPRTVIRAPGGRADLAALARPVVDFAGEAERVAPPVPAALARAFRERVAAFEVAARQAGLRPDAILEARDAMAALVDARARGNPSLDAERWRRALRTELPEVNLPDTDAIEAAARRAAAGGDLETARFLRHCAEGLAAARPAATRPRRWPARLALLGFLTALVGLAAWAEWRHRDRLLSGLPDVATAVGAGEAAAVPLRVAELNAFAAAVDRVKRRAGQSPLGLAAFVPFLDPGAAARGRYAELAGALVPGPLAKALALALATEGEATALYDTLRAVAIFEGRSPWQPRFLEGWLMDRAEVLGPAADLAAHVGAMAGPPVGVRVSDGETREEVRRFAGEGTAAERAYLELKRAVEAGELPAWSPAEAVPGIEPVLVRRSGAPLAPGIPGLFTVTGWEYAREGGATAAVARAAAEGGALLGVSEEASIEAVLDILQRETVLIWRGYLSDLRVRPFADQPEAVMITGALGVRDTPLADLIVEVWRQVGGEDRTRSHSNQLRIAAEFGPAIGFVEAGRMAEIARLFASLNVALQLLDSDADLAAQSVMDLQARAASIAALNQAPLLVVQIVEDVLAQTLASNEELIGNRAVRLWERELGPACAAAVDGRYPFGPGADADPAEVARLLSPEGTVPRFFAAELAPLMEMGATPWRWKPEARLSGLMPESAAFFERVMTLEEAIPDSGGAEVTLTALAQRGAPTVAIGGAAAPVVTSGAPATLAWPGPQPASGFEIVFDTGPRAGASGHWGLLRFLDGVRLRPRKDGVRFLVDIRVEDARVYLQMDFPSPDNIVATRPLFRGLACPARL